MSYNEAQHLQPVPGFPGYSVSRFGRVFNDKTGHEMTPSPNQHGELTVGLMDEGHQKRVSVRNIVAELFVPGKDEINDTAMFLDGDRKNVRADNIVWRPRWFVQKYMMQFMNPKPYFWRGPVHELTRNEMFPNVIHASVANGDLAVEIVLSTFNGNHIFPNRHKYVWAQRE